MTYPDPGGDDLVGLDADPWERQQLDEVVAEVEAEEAAGLPYDDGPGYGDPDGDPGEDEDGSWHDQLGAIGSSLDETYALDSQRAVEDITDQLDRRTPTDEVRAARALRRIGAGT